MMEFLSASDDDVARAAELLRGGGLVAFPTETVYGLGARADDPKALARIFEAKGRPTDHPLIVHLPGVHALDDWARDVPDAAHRLATRFWPGSLTLILWRNPGVLDLVTGCQDTVGVRVPNHPLALALLDAVGLGLAAPSANRFGRLSPTTAAHVADEFGDAVDAVLDGGACEVGLESTIVDLTGTGPRLLRPGAVTREALEEVLGVPLVDAGHDAPRAPGTLPTHYAPMTPMETVDEDRVRPRVKEALAEREGSVAVLAIGPSRVDDPRCVWTTMPEQPASYGRELYAGLREADRSNCRLIVVERPPTGAAWVAVHDRLTRAATKID